MPYQIKEEGGKFCVYNLDSDKKEGEYDDRSQAMKRMKSLYEVEKKNEGKPAKEEVDHGHNDDGEDQ